MSYCGQPTSDKFDRSVNQLMSEIFAGEQSVRQNSNWIAESDLLSEFNGKQRSPTLPHPSRTQPSPTRTKRTRHFCRVPPRAIALTDSFLCSRTQEWAIAYARARSPAYNAFTAPSVWRLFFCSLTLCSRRRLASASSFACRSKFASLAVKK